MKKSFCFIFIMLSLANVANAQPLIVTAGTTTYNNPALNITQTWDGVDGGISFTGIKADFTDILSHAYNSRVMDLKVNGISTFYTDKQGNIVVRGPLGSIGGLGARGSQGEISLLSNINPISGMPSEVFRYYWEGGTPGSASVLYGMGTNRLSIESNGAIVHVAKNSRYEWEGLGSNTINFIGYQAGSANGRSINITNIGQSDEQAVPLMVTNVKEMVSNIVEFRNGETPSTVAFVTSTGEVNASTLVLRNLPTSDPLVSGAVWNDNGTLKISP